jgi:hypothetical protein
VACCKKGNAEQEKKDKMISAQLAEDGKLLEQEVKLLLLGMSVFFFFFFFFFCRVVRLVGSDDVVTGGVCSAGAGQSGKSTVAKQMKIIHMSGFSTEERASYTSVICSNIVVSMRAILAACEEFKVKTSKSNKVRLSNCFFSLFFWGFFFFSFCIFFRPFC